MGSCASSRCCPRRARLGAPRRSLPLMSRGRVARALVYVALVRRFFPLPAATPWFRPRKRLRRDPRLSLPVGAAALAGQLNPQVDKYAIG